MRNLIIIFALFIGLALVKIGLSESAFREYIYIDQYLSNSNIVDWLSLDDDITFKISPFEETEDYLERKKKISPLKNTLAYWLFIGNTMFRVFVIGITLYFLSLIIGYAIHINNSRINKIDSVVDALRSIPAIAWLPFLSSLGIIVGFKGIFFFLMAGILPLTISQIIYSLKTVNPALIDTAKLHNLNNYTQYWKIIRYSKEKELMQGLKYGLSIGLILMLVYEIFFENTPGIMRIIQPLSVGYKLTDSLLLVLLIGLLGVFLNRISFIVLWYREFERQKKANIIGKIVTSHSNL